MTDGTDAPEDYDLAMSICLAALANRNTPGAGHKDDVTEVTASFAQRLGRNDVCAQLLLPVANKVLNRRGMEGAAWHGSRPSPEEVR